MDDLDDKTLDDIEREAILRTLKFFNGSRTKTAKHLRISIRTVRNKITEYLSQGYGVPEPSTESILAKKFNRDRSIDD